MSAGNGEGRPGQGDLDSPNDNTAAIVAQDTDYRTASTCTWCTASLPSYEYACQACKSDVVGQLRRRRDADARLQPLADLQRWSA